MEHWTEKEQTQTEVEVFILDHVFESLHTPPCRINEKEAIAKLAYQHIWQQSAGGNFSAAFAGWAPT
jgi:type I restriction enzyme, R subunit